MDTYGGWGAHGGGAFSGKDPTKVDRSAAYAARWVAKSLVKAGLCQRCLVQVSYSIGVAKPLSVMVSFFNEVFFKAIPLQQVFNYGTSLVGEHDLLQVINDNFDLRPGVIIRYVLPERYLEQNGIFLQRTKSQASHVPAHRHQRSLRQ